MAKITFTDKNTGDQLTAIDVNEIKNVVNENADLINSGNISVSSSAVAPTNANDNDLWWDSSVGRLKIYYNDGDSAQWVDAFPNILQNPNATNPVTASDQPPTSSSESDLWYNTSSGKLFIYYNDGDSLQWVEVSSAL
jgi:hypothetical protein